MRRGSVLQSGVQRHRVARRGSAAGAEAELRSAACGLHGHTELRLYLWLSHDVLHTGCYRGAMRLRLNGAHLALCHALVLLPPRVVV